MAPEVPEGLLKKCNVCKSAILTEDVKKGYYICPKCQNYFRVHAMRRIEMVDHNRAGENSDCSVCGRGYKRGSLVVAGVDILRLQYALRKET